MSTSLFNATANTVNGGGSKDMSQDLSKQVENTKKLIGIADHDIFKANDSRAPVIAQKWDGSINAVVTRATPEEQKMRTVMANGNTNPMLHESNNNLAKTTSIGADILAGVDVINRKDPTTPKLGG
jgi:hypothetical protein